MEDKIFLLSKKTTVVAVFFDEIKDINAIVDIFKNYCSNNDYSCKEMKEIAVSLSVSESDSSEDSFVRQECLSGISIQKNDCILQLQKDRLILTMEGFFNEKKNEEFLNFFYNLFEVISKEEWKISIQSYNVGVLCEFDIKIEQNRWEYLFSKTSAYLNEKYKKCADLWHFFTGMFITDHEDRKLLENIKIRFFREKEEKKKKVATEIHYTFFSHKHQDVNSVISLANKCKQTLFDIINKNSVLFNEE